MAIISSEILLRQSYSPPSRIHPVIGSLLNIKEIDFSVRSKTLILALQTGCHFCNESSPFYERVVEETKSKNIQIIAVLPTNVEESKTHLNQLGLMKIQVKQLPLSTIQVSGTPTLILTNENGKITNFWVGKLSPEKEKEVLNNLNL